MPASAEIASSDSTQVGVSGASSRGSASAGTYPAARCAAIDAMHTPTEPSRTSGPNTSSTIAVPTRSTVRTPQASA